MKKTIITFSLLSLAYFAYGQLGYQEHERIQKLVDGINGFLGDAEERNDTIDCLVIGFSRKEGPIKSETNEKEFNVKYTYYANNKDKLFAFIITDYSGTSFMGNGDNAFIIQTFIKHREKNYIYSAQKGSELKVESADIRAISIAEEMWDNFIRREESLKSILSEWEICQRFKEESNKKILSSRTVSWEINDKTIELTKATQNVFYFEVFGVNKIKLIFDNNDIEWKLYDNYQHVIGEGEIKLEDPGYSINEELVILKNLLKSYYPEVFYICN